MPTRWQFILAVVVLAVVVAAPLVYSSHQHTNLRNFRVVEEGVLYRSGQLSPAGMERVLHDYRINTVVSLRPVPQPGDKSPDDWEEQVCAAHSIKFVRIPPQVWGADETGEIPADEAVKKFLKVMENKANHPVLVHCFAGIHRTGR